MPIRPPIERIHPDRFHPLHGADATRRIEQAAAAALPPHTLMQRAGLAAARLATALAPHARRIWIACGTGNNGGDGLEAAFHLHTAGRPVTATWLGTPGQGPDDAQRSWQRARDAGVAFADAAPQDLSADDLCIDALLGVGFSPQAGRAPSPRLVALLQALRGSGSPLLCVDLPSGLLADTGTLAPGFATPAAPDKPVHTLTLLTLKPGLFTAQGRDAAGTVWLDRLAVDPAGEPATALLAGPPPQAHRLHASHKGSRGDVAVVGGAPGMAGAAVLAATAALHAGAGRVYLALLDPRPAPGLPPELMLRDPQAIDASALTVVCGCGGDGAVAAQLPRLLAEAKRLVLDADALNAVAGDPRLQELLTRRGAGRPTVLTPHPLEAARLLATTAAAVQDDRLAAAQALASRFDCTVVLKGSGSIVATQGESPWVNPTGNGRLATAGTGDVLAGLVGALLAGGAPARNAAWQGVFAHGRAADGWTDGVPLTAQALALRGLEPHTPQSTLL
ncbi:NAD(P)H-hydrate dehydratase [Xylophilus sp.]|uniref:NAD(P)H-hydrate dehydratase n=1 Tax=Xylophilus sp. TaxID=2653893 RepID=UPI0013BB7FD3|nr:NAD(P)H-hydrate dehydratase [Xylophilus sp.]KAF1043393.1 MAG: Bifunctional NAD(P)H-hydrate repair enzyme Nnr [Xylophilus sp.]